MVEVTTIEKVTRSYCDVCGVSTNSGCTHWVKGKPTELNICLKTKYILAKKYPSGKSIVLNCEDMVDLLIRYPSLRDEVLV